MRAVFGSDGSGQSIKDDRLVGAAAMLQCIEPVR